MIPVWVNFTRIMKEKEKYFIRVIFYIGKNKIVIFYNQSFIRVASFMCLIRVASFICLIVTTTTECVRRFVHPPLTKCWVFDLYFGYGIVLNF